MKAIAVKLIRDQARFHPGDDVGLLLGPRYVHGTVVEDRGFIASGGRQMVMIRVNLGEDVEFEMPEDLLERFPMDDPAVASAYEDVEDEIKGYKNAFSENGDRKLIQVRRTAVRKAYRKLLWTLKESAPQANLDALQASVPTNLVTNLNITLGKEIPPKISDV